MTSIELPVVKKAAEFGVSAIKALWEADEKKRQQLRAAMPKLQEAVLETKVYLASREDGTKRDKAVESHLVRLWRHASTGFYGIDGALAERLQLKAEFWADPDAWEHHEVLDAGIALQYLAELTRQLLREGK